MCGVAEYPHDAKILNADHSGSLVGFNNAIDRTILLFLHALQNQASQIQPLDSLLQHRLYSLQSI